MLIFYFLKYFKIDFLDPFVLFVIKSYNDKTFITLLRTEENDCIFFNTLLDI